MPQKILPEGGGALPDQKTGPGHGQGGAARELGTAQPGKQPEQKQKHQGVADIKYKIGQQGKELGGGQNGNPSAVSHVNAFLGKKNVQYSLQAVEGCQGAVRPIAKAAGIEIIVRRHGGKQIEEQGKSSRSNENQRRQAVFFDSLKDCHRRIPPFPRRTGRPVLKKRFCPFSIQVKSPRGLLQSVPCTVLNLNGSFIKLVSEGSKESVYKKATSFCLFFPLTGENRQYTLVCIRAARPGGQDAAAGADPGL